MPSKHVMILDTSVLCVWLKVPGKETCGSGPSSLDFDRVDKEIQTAIQMEYTLVLPLASIIETGNHIAQAPQWRYERASALAELMAQAADQTTPWAAFSDQQLQWSPGGLKALAAGWPNLAAQKLSLGDATIALVADYYAQMGCEVELYTGDKGLQRHQAVTAPVRPRRRR
ncbi:MAG: hypothetical protein HS113_25565 [Verrucomicrobiales bacterium]|nr:hypothetical protein [Verrucomicrobiales bacterium]